MASTSAICRSRVSCRLSSRRSINTSSALSARHGIARTTRAVNRTVMASSLLTVKTPEGSPRETRGQELCGERVEIGPAAGARGKADGFGVLTRTEQRDFSERLARDVSAARHAVLDLALGQDVHVAAVDLPGAMAHRHALEREQPLLEPDPGAGIAREIAAAADHTMARDRDGDGIVPERL